MMLEDVRDYIASLNLSEHTYMGMLDSKKEKSFGVYNSKHGGTYKNAIGGPALQSYGIKNVSFLVHWNKSPRETERASRALFEELETARDIIINDQKIKFIQLLCNEPINVEKDDDGIYEMVIEAAVVYAK